MMDDLTSWTSCEPSPQILTSSSQRQRRGGRRCRRSARALVTHVSIVTVWPAWDLSWLRPSFSTGEGDFQNWTTRPAGWANVRKWDFSSSYLLFYDVGMSFSWRWCGMSWASWLNRMKPQSGVRSPSVIQILGRDLQPVLTWVNKTLYSK